MLSPQSVAVIDPLLLLILLLAFPKALNPTLLKVKTINRLPSNQEEPQHQQRWRERGLLGSRARERERRRVWTAGPARTRPHPPFNYCALAPIPTSPSRPSLDPLWVRAGNAAVSFVLFFPSLLRTPDPLKRPLPLPSSPDDSSRLPISANTPRTNAVTMLSNLFFYVFISLLLSSAAAMSAYDVLKSHGLPMGLLPKGVRAFRVDNDGRFEVRLDAACTAKFESQSEVRFNSTIAGTLSYGQIAALSGVAAQELFLWFPVRGIRVDIPSSGLIYFDVGVIYKRFSLSLFETPLDCIPVSSSSKSESGKLRYELDRGDAQWAVL